MQIRMYGQTDVGLVRESNQDHFYCNADYGIAIVSDGMGGHKGGEIASQMVVNGLREAYFSSHQILADQVESFLDDVLKRINTAILNHAKTDPRVQGMGATVNYLQVGGGIVAIGHAGDSRTYLVRSYNKLSHGQVVSRYGFWQLTIDHNVETFVDRGLLVLGRDLPPGPLSSRQKSRLTRGMGVLWDLRSDLYRRELREDDVFLTCSDGLHGFVSDKDILQKLMSGPISQAPQRLIDLAKQAGAPDNVTVVITVCSNKEEPLHNPDPFVWEHHPYLVRTLRGDILGPFAPDHLIDKWVANKIPGGAEVCKTLLPWCFLNQPRALFNTYRIFNTERVRNHLRLIAEDSLEPTLVTSPESLRPIPRKKPQIFRATVPSYLFILILFISIVALSLIAIFRKV